MDSNIKARYEAEVYRLQDRLMELEPGTEEYEAVQTELLKAIELLNEVTKVDDARKGAKVDIAVRIGTFTAGLIVTPLITYKCQKHLAEFIGKVEQMETFTTMPGRAISSWFRWK